MPSIEDEWLWGWDPTPGIVSVWAEPDGRATVWRRLPATGELVVEEEHFRPWLLLDSLDDLALLFVWQGERAHAGAIADIAGRPEVHGHWLFFFRIGGLDAALAATRSTGGKVFAPIALPDGRRVGVCEDPQGAASGFVEAAR